MARRAKAATGIEQFAEDLGTLLGKAQAKAEGWLGQRQTIAKQLQQIRDSASGLLEQLSTGRKRGRAAAQAASKPTRRRKLSAKARKAISDAQKRRWAAVRAGKK